MKEIKYIVGIANTKTPFASFNSIAESRACMLAIDTMLSLLGIHRHPYAIYSKEEWLRVTENKDV